MIDPANDDLLLDWLSALSEWDRTRDGARLEEVLAYGDHAEQVIDRWGKAPKPGSAAIITLHGGYFLQQFGRDLQNPFVRGCAELGLPVYNVEYRREGCGGSLETTTQDVRAAVDFLMADQGVTRFAVLGHSAGGYLSLTLADHPAIDLVVAMGSVCDLVATVRSGLDEGAVMKWLGTHPDDSPSLYAAADLMARPPARARQILIHGIDDRVVDIAQSRDFVRQARIRGADVDLIELNNEGHFCFMDPREPAFASALAPVRAWQSASKTD